MKIPECRFTNYIFVVTAIDAAGNESQPYINTPSGIQCGIVHDFAVYGGNGVVHVSAVADTEVWVYSVMGQLLHRAVVPAGSTEIGLPAGLYIVNGEKVAVH